MRYGSVCSGVEAATVAWHPLGWEPQWFSEIEKFPSAVLQHHYPDVPNFGDMTKFKEWPDDRSIELLVGGTPCQSFSVAGLRKGLDDPRGNLMLTYLSIAAKYRPRWVVWENVPGVLSSNKGRDFGTFLGALGKIGYGFAYRLCDAQYWGLAQRRKRVFVVGYLGDWRRAAAVLFERESLQGHPPPSRETGQEVAGAIAPGAAVSGGGGLATGETTLSPVTMSITASLGRGGADLATKPMALVPETAGSLDTECGGGKLTHQSAKNGHLILEREVMGTLTARALAALGARDIEEGVVMPVAFDAYNQEATGDVSKTVAARADQDTASCVAFPAELSGTQSATTAELSPALSVTHKTAVAFQSSQSGVRLQDTHATLDANNGSRRHNGALVGMQVRRLTPRECERLQGFPDDYTRIPWRNKAPENCPDGPRYKAMGNSMAVPVMRWIGERIQMVEDIT